MVETKTVEMKVDASELKGDEKDLISKLSDFLKDKTGGEVSLASEVVTIKGQGEALSKKYIRVTVKKFLHKHNLTEQFRVIGGEENLLKVKERITGEEED
ncbi:MAG: 60S ribosomal protein L22 [Candidatus Bathyarchaeia archaeon]|jgi:glycine cleavage system regulatory protein